jgi:hypothetical protein
MKMAAQTGRHNDIIWSKALKVNEMPPAPPRPRWGSRWRPAQYFSPAITGCSQLVIRYGIATDSPDIVGNFPPRNEMSCGKPQKWR